MSKGWSESDKKIVKTAISRARLRAEDETLQKYRATKIDSIDELWEMELKIRQWRRDVKDRFYFSYDRVEDMLHEFLKIGWTLESDLSSLSEERFENIKKGQKKCSAV